MGNPSFYKIFNFTFIDNTLLLDLISIPLSEKILPTLFFAIPKWSLAIQQSGKVSGTKERKSEVEIRELEIV